MQSTTVLIVLVMAFAALSAVNAQSPIYRVTRLDETPNGFTGLLTLQSGATPYGGDIHNLAFDVFFESETRVHFKIKDAVNRRWEVPSEVLHSSTPKVAPEKRQYVVTIGDPFSIKIVRADDSNDVIFDSTGLPFAFADQYLSIGTRLPSQNPNLYGFGERVHNFRLDPKNVTYTIFNRDRGTPPDRNLYGSHPFYLEVRDGGVSHGVFLFNSNAMDVVVNEGIIQYKVIGGVLDFYVFLGPKPEQVIQQYHEVVGRPYMPPAWALGFHQCRWGYNNLSETQQVVENYRKYSIPLEAMWNDIDYMDEYKIFTTDPKRYPMPALRRFVDELHTRGMKYIVIVDPGVKIEPGYEAYEYGNRLDIWIKKSDGRTPIENVVWPGKTVFPDFTNPAAFGYWFELIRKFHQQLPFDGLWIDMNEIACFCDGQCDDEGDSLSLPEPSSRSGGFNPNDPPYLPGGEPLNLHTLDMDAVQNLSINYNVHNLYGYFEANATRIALEKLRQSRAVVISRSTFSGLGAIASHWLGDNESTWMDMFYSISGILSMNIFGINFVGADICGFNGATTKELCTRWMQLGSFYPFSRNHNAQGMPSQEPYVFGSDTAEISRNALLNRYALLPYWYTLFHNASQHGGTVFKSVLFEFPEQVSSDSVIQYIDRQFMVGPALLVSPVLDSGAYSVDAYFPPALWFDWYTGDVIIGANQFVTLDAPIEKINAHIRGGYIIPTQEPAETTKATRANPFQLTIAPDAHGNSFGDLYLDDGESLDAVEKSRYTYIIYHSQRNADDASTSLTSTVKVNGYSGEAGDRFVLNSIRVFGIGQSPICAVDVNGHSVSSFTIDRSHGGVLRVFDLNLPMTKAFTIRWGCAAQ